MEVHWEEQTFHFATKYVCNTLNVNINYLIGRPAFLEQLADVHVAELDRFLRQEALLLARPRAVAADRRGDRPLHLAVRRARLPACARLRSPRSQRREQQQGIPHTRTV